MSRSRKTVFLLICVILLISSLLVACQPRGYTIYVKSLGGVGVPDAIVTVELPDGIVTETTDGEGKVFVKAKKGEYKVTVSGLPLGFSSEKDTYTTSKDNKTLDIYVSSSVIKDTVPENKVYRTGDVIYDFSITDQTDRNNSVTYTLSEVLETKKMVLLNFWNTHCSPCMSEMPELELAYRQYKDDAEVFGIDVPLLGTDRVSDVRDVRNASYTDPDGNKYSLTFPLAIDSNNMPYHFALTEIPVSVVIDRYGVVALIHSGSMDKSGFAELFAKYTSDDYIQGGFGGGDGPGGDEILEWAKPNVAEPDYSEIQSAINGVNFNGSYYPERESEDAEFSWPWLLGETNGEKYIYPSNHEVNYSFATIYTKVTIDDVSANGNVVLVFDLQWSCENLCDYFWLIVNDTLVYEYTGTEQWGKWQDCYALVADEPGEYTVCMMYYKDQERSEGADTVRIKNMRLITTSEIAIGSLDMPRQAARDWNGSNFGSYVTVVKDDEGFYHKDSATGPYIVADLMNTTPFNNRLETRWSISEFAVNYYFDYNTVDVDDPAYDPAKDDTYAISLWAMAANNSELPGLTLVNDDLITLLNRFIKTRVSNFNDNMWLELCKYFDHYGTDKNDKGISTPDRNPIRGLLNSTAVKVTGEVKEGEFTKAELDDIPSRYTNKVVLPRLIVPRGFKYVFVPQKDGVYRFRSQSKELCDTMAWLYSYDDELLVSTDSQLENPNEEWNFILTYYLKAGQKYILATCFADLGVTGEYTFTTEYLGKSYYAWQYAATNYFTTSDDEMTELVNIMSVLPVLHTDGKYYNAKKDANGNFVQDITGNYVANLDDPIYVDFRRPARFFDDGSLELCFTYSDEATIIRTLSGILSVMWRKNKPTDAGWPAAMPLASIKGSALNSEDWDKLIERLYSTYGDTVWIEGEYVTELKKCTSVGAVADFLKTYYLNLFDQTYIRYDEGFGIPASRYKDYTDIVLKYYNMALANKGTASRGYADEGCVQLTEELRDALDMFCKRVGGFPELDTDWLRLCAHYEYFGPYENDN